MGRVCYVPSLYEPSLYWPSLLCAEFVVGRVCYVPSWPDTLSRSPRPIFFKIGYRLLLYFFVSKFNVHMIIITDHYSNSFIYLFFFSTLIYMKKYISVYGGISTLWHFRLPLPIQMFIKVASSPRLSGIGMPSPILWSHPLKMQRIVLLSSLLWWELGTNSLITGPGEWLSFRRFTSNYPDPDPDPGGFIPI